MWTLLYSWLFNKKQKRFPLKKKKKIRLLGPGSQEGAWQTGDGQMRIAFGTDSWCWAFIKESCWRYPVGVTKSPDCINLSATSGSKAYLNKCKQIFPRSKWLVFLKITLILRSEKLHDLTLRCGCISKLMRICMCVCRPFWGGQDPVKVLLRDI